MLYFF